MACDCINKMNELLQPHNAALVTNILSTPKAFVETYVLAPKRGAKAPKVQATYCPFCGAKYDAPPPQPIDTHD